MSAKKVMMFCLHLTNRDSLCQTTRAVFNRAQRCATFNWVVLNDQLKSVVMMVAQRVTVCCVLHCLCELLHTFWDFKRPRSYGSVHNPLHPQNGSSVGEQCTQLGGKRFVQLTLLRNVAKRFTNWTRPEFQSFSLPDHSGLRVGWNLFCNAKRNRKTSRSLNY